MVLKSCFLLPLFVEKVSRNRIYLLNFMCVENVLSNFMK